VPLKPTSRRSLLRGLLAAPLLALARPVAAQAPPESDEPAWLRAQRPTVERILAAAREDGTAWRRLAELTDTFGPRPSGSAQLEAALHWSADRMREDGLSAVRLERVEVPVWVRGRESARLVEPDGGPLVMLGLGGSVGTPAEGLEGELVAVSSFEELEARAAAVAGRIVLFDVPYVSYGETVEYRSSGASRAARLGARAMLLRSVGPTGLRTPHTGALRYAEDAPRIPAAALAAEDVARLRRLLDAGRTVRVHLEMEAAWRGPALSANLVAELPGRERPEEIVLLGGHLDSWDVGTGAMDDADGCLVTWDALRLLHRLGLAPRRTLRVALFTNEENGLAGGKAYLERHGEERHVLTLECDSGVFRPRGFGFTGAPAAREALRPLLRLLAPIGADQLGERGGGSDIGPLVRAKGVPALSLDTANERYFIYHHTPADTIDRLEEGDLRLGVAAVAALVWLAAEMPEPLPASPTA
jgi:carboxypeptidase Q